MDVLWLGQQHFTGRAQPCSAFQLVQHEEEEKKKKGQNKLIFSSLSTTKDNHCHQPFSHTFVRLAVKAQIHTQITSISLFFFQLFSTFTIKKLYPSSFKGED